MTTLALALLWAVGVVAALALLVGVSLWLDAVVADWCAERRHRRLRVEQLAIEARLQAVTFAAMQQLYAAARENQNPTRPQP